MRFLLLYLRSRQVPVALLGITGLAGLLCWELASAPSEFDVLPVALACAVAPAVASVGLAGADVELERTAALAWPPRRAVHLIAVAAFTVAVLAAARTAAGSTVATEVIVRDVVGLAGASGLGVAAFGVAFGWLVPLPPAFTAALPSLGVPRSQTALTWLTQPPNTPSATVIALALGASGLLCYSAFGAHRR